MSTEETKETKTKATKTTEPEGAPVAESGPAIAAATAVYPPGPGNWSDPPELAAGEAEIEGSFASKPEEEVKEERDKIVKEAEEKRAKALEENDQKARDRAEHDAKAAKA